MLDEQGSLVGSCRQFEDYVLTGAGCHPLAAPTPLLPARPRAAVGLASATYLTCGLQKCCMESSADITVKSWKERRAAAISAAHVRVRLLAFASEANLYWPRSAMQGAGTRRGGGLWNVAGWRGSQPRPVL